MKLYALRFTMAFAYAVALTAFAAAPITLAPGDSVTISAQCGGSGGLTCAPPAVLNAQGTACVNPPLVCTPPAVLNAAGTACVIPNNDSACGVTGGVRHLTMDWFDPHRLYTRDVEGGFGPNDAVVVEFKTGMVSSVGSLPRIAAAEYGSSPSSRIATLSAKPCDFGPQPTLGAAGEGNSVTMVFALGTGNGFGYYPVLGLQTTYYLNIKNSPSSSCVSSGVCDMFVDLVKPGGL